MSANQQGPPEPRSIPPVGNAVPIDSNINLLFACSLLLGSFFILKKSKEKK